MDIDTFSSQIELTHYFPHHMKEIFIDSMAVNSSAILVTPLKNLNKITKISKNPKKSIYIKKSEAQREWKQY